MSIVPADNIAVVRAMPAEQQAVAVTNMLTEARSWLAHAVESTGPETIANFKAQMATMAEATKQLGLSKDIQNDAVEMVRRAERGVGQAIRRGQAEGTVRSQGEGSKDNLSGPRTKLPSPYDFATKHELHGSGGVPGIYDLADIPEEEFEDALAAAKAEGAPSRSNVARKAHEIAGKAKARPRKPLTDTARDLSLDLDRLAGRVQRFADDDRFARNKDEVAARLRHHLAHAIEVLSDLNDQLN